VPVVGVEGKIPVVEGLNNKQINEMNVFPGVAELIDLKTKKSFKIYANAPRDRHTDWSPLTSADTDVIKRINDPSRASNWTGWDNVNNWPNFIARAGVLMVKGRLIAVGFHLRPHGTIIGGKNTQPGLPLIDESDVQPSDRKPQIDTWPMGGHMCMYYLDSIGGTSGCNEKAEEAARKGFLYV